MTSDLKQKILSAVRDDLEAIEVELRVNLAPQFDLVSRVAGHILFAGGKRLRPLLMVLSARMCGYVDPQAARFATIFEYLHAATLLHDDLVDGSAMRRGRRVANQVWDNPTAVLTGDFLLARGLSIAADTGLSEVIRTIARITENMSQGEIRQLERKGDPSLSEAEYMDVIRCKTAVLFEGACRTGALVAGGPPEAVQGLSDFGHHLGLAFQMADDLLDYTQDGDAMGKHAGADFREGKLTLPLIYALSRASDAERQRLTTMLGNPDLDRADFIGLVKLLEKTGGIAYTRTQAADHIQRAKTHLDQFDSHPTCRLLQDIADYALARHT